MFKYLLSLLTICLFIGCNLAYKSPLGEPRDRTFSFQIDEGSKLIEAGYNYSLERTASGTGLLKKYYPSTGVMTDYITYKSRKQIKKHGKMIKWFDNGDKFIEGHYKDNLQEGEWKYYHHNCKTPYSYGHYIAGKKEGVWTSLDSLGHIRSTHTYKAGLKQGPYQIFNAQGEMVEEGKHQKEERIDRSIHREEEQEVVKEHLPFIKSCKNEDLEVQKKCSNRIILESLYNNIKYPRFAREMDIQGIAIVRFVISETGQLENPVVLRGLCDEIKAECIRVLDHFPEWHPAMQNGKPVRAYFNLPIKFRIEN